MRLARRPDWPEAAERLTRWWSGASLGRPAMSITAPKDGASYEALPEAPSLWDHWTNPDYVMPRVLQSVRNTAWFAEACPMAWVNLGAVAQVGFLGTEVVCAPDTVWHRGFVEDWEAYEPTFDRQNEWWRIEIRLTEAFLNEAEGQWFVANADLAETGDVMSALRGPQKLCLDLIEGPREAMERVRDQLAELLLQWYDEFSSMITARMEGSSSWLRVWHPGRTATVQCDFSCMVSKEMFDGFFLPPLSRGLATLDGAMYHLDGAGAVQHVDTIMALPNMRAIQWVPGSGDEGPAHPKWRPLLRRIIGGGLCVHLSVSPGEIENLVRDLGADGLYLVTSCASEREARELLDAVERWSRQ